MARRPRREAASGIHHVMNRGVNRDAVFFGDVDRVEFGRGLREIHERFGVETIAYCLMGNHYHLLLRASGSRLSAAMHHLGTSYTVRTNQRVGRDGPIFRGRFHSIPVETDTYFTWAARYVHRNALALPGVASAADYRWSSYRTYLGLRRPPAFLNTELLLEMFGGDPVRLGEYTDRPAWFDLPASTVVADVLQLVEFEIGRDDLLAGTDGPSPPWRARTVLVLAVDRLGAHPVAAAIEAHLAFASAAARDKAVGRARRRAREDPAIGRITGRLVGHIARPKPEGV